MIIIADDGKEERTVEIFNYIHTILVFPYININTVSLTLSCPPWCSFRMPSRVSLDSHANRDTKNVGNGLAAEFILWRRFNASTCVFFFVQSNGRAPSPLNPLASSSLLAATLLGTLMPQQSPNISWTWPSVSSFGPRPNPSSGGGIIDPNKKCCITVRFPRTSPRNILPIPSRTLDQVFTPEISSNIGLCHLNPTVFTALIWAIQPRYM